MRILHVVSSFGMGGAESVAFKLAALQASEHDVSVLAVRGRQADTDPISKFNIKNLARAGCSLESGYGRSRNWSLATSALRIAWLHRRNAFDIVHSHTDIPDMCVSLASRVRVLPVVRTIHNTRLWPTRRRSAKFVESAFHEDLVVAIGEDTLEAYTKLRRSLNLPISPFLKIIPNEADLDRTLSVEAERISEQLAKSNRLKLLFLGRLEPQKGFDILANGLPTISADLLRDVELHVIGTGSLRSMGDRVTNLPVYFHGAVPNAAALLTEFDLVLAPSRFEGMPLVPLEAKASGVPAIVSDGPGMREVYPDGWPLSCHAGDVQDFAKCLQEALKSMDKYKAQAKDLVGSTGKGAHEMNRRYLIEYAGYLSSWCQKR